MHLLSLVNYMLFVEINSQSQNYLSSQTISSICSIDGLIYARYLNNHAQITNGARNEELDFSQRLSLCPGSMGEQKNLAKNS